MDKSKAVTLNTQTWLDWKTQFPTGGSDNEKLRFLLRYAVLAPSSHNAQPWIWEVSDDHADLYADRNRALPVSDPEGSELLMGCGAALLHLRLAIRHFGYTDHVELLPGAKNTRPDPDLLARVTLGERALPEQQSELLFEAMAHRHTNRSLFLNTPVPANLQEKLRHEAACEGAWLHLVENSLKRTELIDLIAQGDTTQWHEREFRREHAGWIRPHQSKSADGIPGNAMGLSQFSSRVAPVALPLLDVSEAQADKDWLLAGSAPVLAILGTDLDGPQDWLGAGQALARVLLHASAAGLSVSFFNGPIEIDALRPRLHEIIGRSGYPQLMFRLGHSSEDATPTARRAAEDVTTCNITLHSLAKYFRHSRGVLRHIC